MQKYKNWTLIIIEVSIKVIEAFLDNKEKIIEFDINLYDLINENKGWLIGDKKGIDKLYNHINEYYKDYTDKNTDESKKIKMFNFFKKIL